MDITRKCVQNKNLLLGSQCGLTLDLSPHRGLSKLPPFCVWESWQRVSPTVSQFNSLLRERETLKATDTQKNTVNWERKPQSILRPLWRAPHFPGTLESFLSWSITRHTRRPTCRANGPYVVSSCFWLHFLYLISFLIISIF